jgi:hypothetical protein
MRGGRIAGSFVPGEQNEQELAEALYA